MLNLFPKHQYLDTSVGSVYFQGLCRQQWLKDEILSVTVPAVSIEPRCQSQDLKPPVWPTKQKETTERRFCPKHFTVCFSEKRWQRGANNRWRDTMKQGVWSAGSAAVSESQVPFHGWFVWRHHFCACCGNWGTAGVGTGYLQYSDKWAFLWMMLSFDLFWTNHVIKEQDLTFALILLASTIPACLWPLPEIGICWASCCLLWLSLDLFLIWLQ